jgi:tetratricopeptide (TPR) repeat protein
VIPDRNCLPQARWAQQTGARRAGDFLHDARGHERAGCMAEALQCYAAAVEAAERDGERGILAESLRRLGVVYHQRDERARARELCERSYQTARDMRDAVLAAEALNALAGFDFESGAIEAAREKFYRAGPSRTWESSPTSKALWSRRWPTTSAPYTLSRARATIAGAPSPITTWAW